jgi:hypothetical protein
MNDEHPRDDAADDGSSSAGGASALSAVGALMEERRQYETWLAALDARRAETPKHVFTRVHADYTARLESVITRLVAHAEGMRAELTTLTTKLATLDEQHHRAVDERAEAELRAHVGELSADAWKEVAAASDAALASLAAQRVAAEDDLRRTRELLADAERPPTPAPSAAPVPPPAKDAKPAGAPVADAAEAALHVPAAAPPAADAAKRASSNGAFDELAFLQSVVDTSAAGAPDAGAPKPAGPAAIQPPPAAPSAAAPASPAPQRREPFAARKPEPRPEDRIVKQGEGAAPVIQSKRGGGPSLAANISGNNPIVLKDKTTEAAKTLKCAECGAMNYPTEWYCERCGAELASM